MQMILFIKLPLFFFYNLCNRAYKREKERKIRPFCLFINLLLYLPIAMLNQLAAILYHLAKCFIALLIMSAISQS